jgi:hypothetical protein
VAPEGRTGVGMGVADLRSFEGERRGSAGGSGVCALGLGVSVRVGVRVFYMIEEQFQPFDRQIYGHLHRRGDGPACPIMLCREPRIRPMVKFSQYSKCN